MIYIRKSEWPTVAENDFVFLKGEIGYQMGGVNAPGRGEANGQKGLAARLISAAAARASCLVDGDDDLPCGPGPRPGTDRSGKWIKKIEK